MKKERFVTAAGVLKESLYLEVRAKLKERGLKFSTWLRNCAEYSIAADNFYYTPTEIEFALNNSIALAESVKQVLFSPENVAMRKAYQESETGKYILAKAKKTKDVKKRNH